MVRCPQICTLTFQKRGPLSLQKYTYRDKSEKQFMVEQVFIFDQILNEMEILTDQYVVSNNQKL